MPAPEPIPTRVYTRLLARMRRTHERRRASISVGPPGLGKTTAALRLRQEEPANITITRVAKRALSAPQALVQLHGTLRQLDGCEDSLPTTQLGSMPMVQHRIHVLMERIAGINWTNPNPEDFPPFTVIWDEAQRLTNDAIDALRDFTEPFGQCRGPFPLGMIFIGNEELSFDVRRDGTSLLDAGMASRLLYSERLSYADIERADVDAYLCSLGIEDEEARDTLSSYYVGGRVPCDFRDIADLVDALQDEAAGQPITRETVRVHLLG